MAVREQLLALATRGGSYTSPTFAVLIGQEIDLDLSRGLSWVDPGIIATLALEVSRDNGATWRHLAGAGVPGRPLQVDVRPHRPGLKVRIPYDCLVRVRLQITGGSAECGLEVTR